MADDEPLEVPRALAEIRHRSPEEFADARHLRAALSDILDIDRSPGEVRLVLDAVELGAFERMRSLLDAGGEPGPAIDDAAAGLARARASDVAGARWACAALAFSLDAVGEDRVLDYHRTWVGGAAGPLPSPPPPAPPPIPRVPETSSPPPTLQNSVPGATEPAPPRPFDPISPKRTGRRVPVAAVAAGLVAAIVVGVLVVVRLVGSGDGGDNGPGPDDGALSDVPAGDGEVTIIGSFSDAEAEGFEAALADFEQSSGIDVSYGDVANFTGVIEDLLDDEDGPDLALFPGPTLLLDVAQDGRVQPIEDYVDLAGLEETLVPGLLGATVQGDHHYGTPIRVSNKSLVWYPKDAFDSAGYQVPATLDELVTLTDRIRADGLAPWCMAWGADADTGWVGTDWVEQLVLTTQGTDFYDDWTRHRVPFDDDRVVAAFEDFGMVARSPGLVLGGARRVLDTSFTESMHPAFRDPPQCLLERQGSFEPELLPSEVAASLDTEVGVFPFPPLEDVGDATPALASGDLAALVNVDQDTVEVLRFLSSDQFGGPWAATGSWLSPHRTFDSSTYPNLTTRRVAELTTGASRLMFDASDEMPTGVGKGSFWSGMVDWISGKSSAATAADIEASWPN